MNAADFVQASLDVIKEYYKEVADKLDETERESGHSSSDPLQQHLRGKLEGLRFAIGSVAATLDYVSKI